MSKIQVFGHFLRNRSLKVSNFLHDGRGHHLSLVQYLGKMLIRGLRGIKCPKFRFFDIFSETGYYKFLIFCMMVECNRGHHLNVVPYLGKILIRGLRGIKCQKFGLLDIFSETGH